MSSYHLSIKTISRSTGRSAIASPWTSRFMRQGAKADQRNHHAHLLLTTRRLEGDAFGEKSRELDNQRSGEVAHWRERWADLQNDRLAARGLDARVDHRSLADQGLERDPQVHLGPHASAMERRGLETAGLPADQPGVMDPRELPAFLADLDPEVQRCRAPRQSRRRCGARRRDGMEGSAQGARGPCRSDARACAASDA